MDFNPMIMAAIVAVIGACEGTKKKLPNLSTMITSIIAGAILGFSLATITGFDVASIQSILFNWGCTTFGSWLLYESVAKKYIFTKPEEKPDESKGA